MSDKLDAAIVEAARKFTEESEKREAALVERVAKWLGVNYGPANNWPEGFFVYEMDEFRKDARALLALIRTP